MLLADPLNGKVNYERESRRKPPPQASPEGKKFHREIPKKSQRNPKKIPKKSKKSPRNPKKSQRNPKNVKGKVNYEREHKKKSTTTSLSRGKDCFDKNILNINGFIPERYRWSVPLSLSSSSNQFKNSSMKTEKSLLLGDIWVVLGVKLQNSSKKSSTKKSLLLGDIWVVLGAPGPTCSHTSLLFIAGSKYFPPD